MKAESHKEIRLKVENKAVKEFSKRKVQLLPFEGYVLLSCIAILSALGLLMTFSASFPLAVQAYDSPFKLFVKQVISLAVALVAGIFAYWASKKLPVNSLSPVFWIASIFLVILTFVPPFSDAAKGAARWLNFGFIRFQPSEILKISIVLLCVDLSYRFLKSGKKEYLYVAYGAILFSSLMVLLQKDMTTAVIVFFGGFLAIFFTPVSLRELLPLGMVAIAGSIFAVIKEEYRLRRLLVFLDPWKNEDAGRQVIVSLLALAKGGLNGMGIGKSVFKYNVLPEAHTDFIFSIIGSELGLFGSLLIIILLTTAVFSSFRLAYKCKDGYFKSASLALITMLAFQAIVNIGGTLRLLPPTGVPLPFVSFGGTSLVVSYFVVGLILGFCMKKR